MEKMQIYIHYIFHRVWCNAHSAEFEIGLFKGNDELYQIMDNLFRLYLAGKLMDGAGKTFFYLVNDIFNEFKFLTESDINTYRLYFDSNNAIEEICTGSKTIKPVCYEDLDSAHDKLNCKLKVFYYNLYSSGFFGLTFVRKIIGSDIDAYYKELISKNNTPCCPFCGLQPIDNQYDPTREAFDHYLPKIKYPFNTVNLQNLAPSCNTCNSKNKGVNDPLHDKAKARKAFYPFSKLSPDIEMHITFKKTNWVSLSPDLMSIEISSASFPEEVKTWIELFRIDKRYLAKCCDNGGGIYWLNRILNESSNYGLTVNDFFEAEINCATKSPWVDVNFLKKAFLLGCKQTGLIKETGGTV